MLLIIISLFVVIGAISAIANTAFRVWAWAVRTLVNLALVGLAIAVLVLIMH